MTFDGHQCCDYAEMRLTVVGCSPAWPNPGGAQSGYLVESNGGSALLDCGPGVLARLRSGETSLDPDAIVITHFHLDHWGDLVPWVWRGLNLKGQGANVRKPALWLPPGGRELLERFGSLLGFPDMFERVFSPAEYTEGVAFDAGGSTITAVRVPHYNVEAYALRVVGDDRVLTYSGDSGRPRPLSRRRMERISFSARRPCSPEKSTVSHAVTCRSTRLARRSTLPAQRSS